MDYHRYIAQVSESGDRILCEWRWLTGPHMKLWLVTKAGDAILIDDADSSVHFLNTMEAKVTCIASCAEEFEQVIGDAERARELLLTPLVDEMAARGHTPGANQVFLFKHPPVLGGSVSPDNMVLCDVADRFGGTGKIMHQIKDLPDGAHVIIRPEPKAQSTRRPWWKIW